MNSVNFVENINLSEHKISSNKESSSNQTNTNMVICNKCKREIDKFFTKRVFGQKNIYECKGNELNLCEKVLYMERDKKYQEKKKKEKKKKKKDKKYLMMSI